MKRVASLFLAMCLTGCGWVALGYNAVGYPTTATGEAANVVISGSIVYASLAERGLDLIGLSNGERIRTVAPPPRSESIDDIAVADGFLFVLDARSPGYLSVFSLAEPALPVLTASPVQVEVGPFSGVSAGSGHVIVSGGTSSLSLRTYDGEGRLGSQIATIDLGRGQPDVLVAPDGKRAFVSTHFWGPYFGLTTLELGAEPPFLVKADSIDLDTFGFTAGGSKPANFPIDAALADNILLVAHIRGLAIISIDHLGKLRLLSLIDLGVEAVNVDVQGAVAAVVGSSPRPLLVLVDIADPLAPKILRTIGLPEGSLATSVASSPKHLAVAAHKRGTLLFQP